MPCPHICSAPYSTSSHTIYLCENPIRGGEVFAPDLVKLRDHCLTDAGFESCEGYQQARNLKDPPTQ